MWVSCNSLGESMALIHLYPIKKEGDVLILVVFWLYIFFWVVFNVADGCRLKVGSKLIEVKKLRGDNAHHIVEVDQMISLKTAW